MAAVRLDSTPASRLRSMGRALAHREYRLFFAGQGVSLIGTWMTRLASGWLVYRLAGPDAPWLLGVVSFASLAPTFALAPLAGVFVDRWDRHRVLVATQILSMIQSALLAVVAFRAEPGTAAVWWVAGLGVFQGVVNAFDMPARQSLLVRIVARREDLPNAIALNSSLVNGSRLIGPAAAGAVIAAAGAAWCFVIDAVSYVAVVAALLAMRFPRQQLGGPAGGGRRAEGGHSPASSIGRQLWEGVRYVGGFPPIRALLLLLALVSFATMPQSVLMPVFAVDVLGGGPQTLGLLSAASGLGALTGAMYLASRRSVLGLGRLIVIATAVLGLGLLGFAESRAVWLSAMLLVTTGWGMMVQMAACNTIIQTIVDEDKRGRVMSFYGMAFRGAAPFGSLLAGWLAGRVGVATVVLGSGAVVLLGGLAFATQLPRLRGYVRPIYTRLGILPEAAGGLNTATELAPQVRG